MNLCGGEKGIHVIKSRFVKSLKNHDHEKVLTSLFSLLQVITSSSS